MLFPFLFRPVPKDQWPILLGAVFFMGTLHFALIFTGSHYSNASTVAIVNQLNVPFGSLLAMWWLGEVVRWRRWTGIALSFIGVAIFNFEANTETHAFGITLLILDAAAMGVGAVMLRRLSGVEPFPMQAWMAAMAYR